MPHWAGSIFHVIGRGNDRGEIARDDRDYAAFLGLLRTIKAKTGFKLHAYCLMPNHYHLLLEVGAVALSVIMQRLLSGYPKIYHRRWGTSGHLFQGRYKALYCGRDAYFTQLVRYIHLNPVKAGLAGEAGGWRWSGHGEVMGTESRGLLDLDLVLDLFDGRPGYAQAVAVPLSDGLLPAEQQREVRPADLPPAAAQEKEALESIARRIVSRNSVTMLELLSRSALKKVAQSRREFVREAAMQGHRTGEIAEYLGRKSGAVSVLLFRMGR